jgi:hypothetical protein
MVSPRAATALEKWWRRKQIDRGSRCGITPALAMTTSHSDGTSGCYQCLATFICPSKPFGHVNFGVGEAPARRPIESGAETITQISPWANKHGGSIPWPSEFLVKIYG